MVEQNATTRPSSHTFVFTLSNTNEIGIHLYNLFMYAYIAQVHHTVRKDPFSLVISHEPGRSTKCVRQPFRLVSNPKHHQERSSTGVSPVSPKCGTTPRSEWTPLNSAKSSPRTPKCEIRRLFALVNSFMLTTYRCRHLLQTIWPWKNTQNYFYAPLDNIASSRWDVTPKQKSRTEYATRHFRIGRL